MHRTFSTEELTGTHVRMTVGFCDRLLEVARAEIDRHGDLDDTEPARVLEIWLERREAGRFVPVAAPLLERLIVAAENNLARRGNPPADTPELTIASWLDDLEKKRTGPFPTVESGDLLVKVGRAEFWTFTVQGWRELAPIELQVDLGAQERKTYESAWEATLDDRGGVKARAGYSHPIYEAGPLTGPPSRFFGRSVVEDELDRARAQREPFPAGVQATLDELLHHHNVLESIAAALEQGEDGGNSHPFFESAATARVFARALDYARRRLLLHATDAKIAAR